MNTKQSVRSIGIWMDHTEARLLEPGQTADSIRVIPSQVTGRERVEGEVANGTRLGNFRSTNNEAHRHNREQNEIRAFYRHLADELLPYERILLCGPASACREFHNFLQKEKRFADRNITTMAEDYLSDPEWVECVNRNLLSAVK
jgi:hypothetical protein